ncbi:MAG: tetratricopeptide repeat protein, partial [Deltaproteobacteria bacterium]|nr:tetratricopeptide repeat protein [Deltaproteobacteria bacterium]
DKDEQVFIIKKVDGSQLEFTELETLHQWIIEGIADEKSQITSTGDSWAYLSDLEELEEVFLERDNLNQFSNAEETNNFKKEPELGLGRMESGEVSVIEPDFNAEMEPDTEEETQNIAVSTPEKRKKWPWILSIIILILGVSLGGLFYMDILTSPFVSSQKSIPLTSTKTNKNKNSDNEILYNNTIKILKPGTPQAVAKALDYIKECSDQLCLPLKAFVLSLDAFYKFVRLDLFSTDSSSKSKNKVIKQQRNNMIKQAKKAIVVVEQIKDADTTPLARAAKLISQKITKPLAALEKPDLSNPYNKFSYIVILYLANNHKKNLQNFSESFFKESFLQTPGNVIKALTYYKLDNQKDALKEFGQLCNNRPDFKTSCQMQNRINTVLQEEEKVADKDTNKDDDKKIKQNKSKKKSDEDDNLSGSFDDYYMKAQHYYKINKKDRAKNYYLKAAKKDPTSADPYNGAGWCDMDKGQPGSAVKYFKKALALVPYYSRARFGLAEALYKSGRKREALEHYRKYLNRHSGSRRITRVKMQIKTIEKALGIKSDEKKTDSNSSSTENKDSSGEDKVLVIKKNNQDSQKDKTEKDKQDKKSTTDEEKKDEKSGDKNSSSTKETESNKEKDKVKIVIPKTE